MKITFAPFYVENPYQINLQEHLEKLGHNVFRAPLGVKKLFDNPQTKGCQIIHFHWTHPYVLRGTFSAVVVKICYFLYKLITLEKNKRIIWTVHNLNNHNRKYARLENFFIKKFVHLVDGFSVHNEYTKTQLQKRFNIASRKIFLIPHANYIDVYPSGTDNMARVQTMLGLKVGAEKRTFMLFGHIRAYKGALDVISAFKVLDTNKNQLIICGKMGDDQDLQTLEKEIIGSKNIYIYPKFVPHEDINAFFDLADVMLYPYKDITTSGSLLLGMSFGKPCLCADVGDMGSLVGNQSTFNGQSEFQEKLLEFACLTDRELVKLGVDNFNKVKPFSWDRMAKETKEMYEKVLKA